MKDKVRKLIAQKIPIRRFLAARMPNGPDLFWHQRMGLLLDSLADKGSVLDAGCGNGSTAIALAERGHRVLGVDMNRDHVEYARNLAGIRGIDDRASFLVDDIKKFSVEEKFDYIVCFEVVEHIIDDNGVLKHLSKYQNVSGAILITSPNKNSVHLYGDGVHEVEDGGHVRWGYSFEELERLLSENGYEVVRNAGIGSFFTWLFTNIDRFLLAKLLGNSFLVRTLFLWIVKPLTALDKLTLFWPPYALFVMAKRVRS